MAKNIVRHETRFLNVPVIAGILSGDPVQVGTGDMTGVAQTDRDANGNATIDRGGSYKLNVYGHDGAANKAVAVGDKLYLDAANKRLTVNNALPFFGYAQAVVNAGATTQIEVVQKGAL